MDWFVVEGLAPYEGRYPWDLIVPNLTVREWTWVQELAGVYPATYLERAGAADARLMAVLVVLAIRRAGTIGNDGVEQLVERLKDVTLDDNIRFELGDPDTQEDDAGPPPTSSSSNGGSSGEPSTTPSESSAETPPNTGAQRSG